MRHLLMAAALLAAVAAPGALVAQQAARPDTLIGRVTTDSAVALDSAEVIVTRGPDRVVFRTRTGADGRWRLVVDEGTGDYLVYVTAPGRIAQRSRVTRKGTEQRFTVDVALAAVPVQQLARVEVRATKREAPQRGPEPARGGVDAERDAITGALGPAQMGDPSALASTVPGLQLGRDGVSALGLPGAQTLFTVNGLGGAIADVPRALWSNTGTRVATSSFDVSRGGFSGAQVDFTIDPASVYSTRNAHIAVDAPWLQATDAVGSALGQRFGRVDASLGVDGELGRADKWTYASGLTLRRYADATPSLATAPDAALAGTGIPRDTVRRVLGDLARLGIPVGTLDGTVRTDAVALLRIDRMGWDPRTEEQLPRAYGAMGYLKLADARGVGLDPTATPSAAGTSRDVTAALQLNHSLRTSTWLHDTKTSLSIVDARTTPSLLAPRGTVRTTASDAAAGGIATLGFGGNDFLASDRTQVTWDAQHESQAFTSGSSRHRIKLFGQARVDATAQRATPGALGSFAYNSLADLEAGRPASFSRVLALPAREGSAWNAAVGIGSVYRRSALFSMQYGARIEAGGFLARPDANPALARALGARTDVAPAEVAVLPRLGFRWVYTGKPGDGGGTMWSPIGRYGTEVRGVLRGGVGLFRNFVGTDAIAQAVAATGLPGSTLRLDCVGDAIPTPDWDAYLTGPGSIPARCAGPALPLVQPALAVQALDRDWRTPRSWRANLGWTTRVLKTDITLEGVASLNLSQPSVRDANFAGRTGELLAGEGNRPLFVPLAQVVPATGAISPQASRVDPTWAQAMVAGAQGRSESAQLRLQLTPSLPGRAFLRGNYVVGRVRERLNGFDRNTAGDPRAFEWAPGDLDVRHQLQLQGGWYSKWLTVTGFVDVTSGRPFTPLVRGDVNGDGLAFNDRAFVARGAGDPATAAAIAALAASSPGRVRDCLLSVADAIAPRNGCRGPWQARTMLQLGTNLPGGRAFQWVQLQLFLENPLAGLDRLLHGDAIRGWGIAPEPDPVLLAVRGFDPATRRYAYDVNARFGATDPQRTAMRAPFRATLNVSVVFGPSTMQQMVDRALRPGRRGAPGVRPDSATLHTRYARTVPNPIAPILEERDSLLLTGTQVRALEALEVEFRKQADAQWGRLAGEFAAYGDSYDGKAALARQEETTDAVWEIARATAAKLTELLTPVQHTLLPYPANWLRTAKPGFRIRFISG